MDAALVFAQYFANAKYDDLPPLVVESEKMQLLDTLGVALAGMAKPGIVELFNLIKHWGGRRESTIIGYGIKVPAPNAAQVNASMSHALDYDNGNPKTMEHTGTVIIPTCLAVAEQKGKVSGKSFILASALGTELMCRLGLATRPTSNIALSNWHFTPLYGYMAAAVSAGKLLGLNENLMANALGLAYHQTAGNHQGMTEGTMAKRMGPGFAAKGGITAAFMAKRGIDGAKNSLEGPAGLFNLYHQGDYDPKILIRDLGKVFESTGVRTKLYPCCGITHVFIDAALSLSNEYKIKPYEIDQIIIYGGEGGNRLSTPIEEKRKPKTFIDAQFNVPWVVATAFVRGKPSMEHFTDEAIQSKDILEVTAKIRYE
ncbi:MAG: MmgE/PrpD family protein, partial [Dehalococcoidales bacterium]|nr:MmgE/PrpD family protein [Dehalococcoidales bacterium]